MIPNKSNIFDKDIKMPQHNSKKKLPKIPSEKSHHDRIYKWEVTRYVIAFLLLTTKPNNILISS